MTAFVLDIETFAIDDADTFLEPVAAPANYKDPVKIQQYCEERRAALLSKCALDPDLCRVVAIGVDVIGSSGPAVHVLRSEAEERRALELFWASLWSDEAVAIGFNILAFDLPILIRRSQYLGVPSRSVNLDRYRTSHVDLLERLTFNGKIGGHSLAFYCQRFGIPCEDESTGEAIDGFVRAGDWDAVGSHCEADLRKTRALAERLGMIHVVAA